MKPDAAGRMSEVNGFSQFQEAGFQIVKSFITHDECDLLNLELTPLFEQQQKSGKSKIGGVRNLLQTNSRVHQFATSPKVGSLVEGFAGKPAFPVRAIFFDKNPDSNWVVPWHQDLAIAVDELIETSGFTGWSVKDGAHHVHPPNEVLESMLTLRLHLDDCARNNGALKVFPKSHCHGKLGAADISKWQAGQEPLVCELSKGDGLLMRPLLLHASSSVETPAHRRVLHIEYATQRLPNGLKWLEC